MGVSHSSPLVSWWCIASLSVRMGFFVWKMVPLVAIPFMPVLVVQHHYYVHHVFQVWWSVNGFMGNVYYLILSVAWIHTSGAKNDKCVELSPRSFLNPAGLDHHCLSMHVLITIVCPQLAGSALNTSILLYNWKTM